MTYRPQQKLPNTVRTGGEMAYVSAGDVTTIRIGNSGDVRLTTGQAITISRDFDLHPVTPNAIIDVVINRHGEAAGFVFAVRPMRGDHWSWIPLTSYQIDALDLQAHHCFGDVDGEPCGRVAQADGFCEVCS